ncbi:MAG: Rieske 2Fe-2S domain-containing protein [Immundisolibacteraceae bacterium]|nr:Rieske 2Fe-2S domain-containing protein [Immundisolibacteraceae bacterium]
MNAPSQLNVNNFNWPEEGLTRVPYRVFNDPAIHDLEQQRIFRGPTWSYAGLDAELPNKGDYITTFIGDTPVVVSRDQQDKVHAFVNRCAHRGALVCRQLNGNTDVHTCVYHQWAFDLSGDLVGVPFRRGLAGKGGYPEDFDMADHGLQKLRVSTLHGLIYVTFDFDLEPLEDYLGKTMVGNLDRCLEGRQLEVLGYSRQYINSNWKLYGENTRDSYHAMLLHLFYPTFGIATPATKTTIEMSEERYHNLFTVWRPSSNENLDTYKENTTRSFKGGKEALQAPEFLRFINERDDDIAITIESLFPNSVFQHIQNGFAIRQIRPKKIDEFELHWTYIGYTDDSPEMRKHRLLQANMLGPAGLIAMEDAEAGEIIQKGIIRDADQTSFVEMGGDGYGDLEGSGTDENSIRVFWKGYRKLMGI